MVRKALIFLCAALCCFASGCAKLSREYTPPTVSLVKNSQVFSESYDAVWKATIDSVAKSFWSLSNIEKDSGILSLYFITDNPSECVDCGTTKVELVQFGKDAGTIVRKVAQPRYEYETHGGKHHNTVIEQSELRCDCNIVIGHFHDHSLDIESFFFLEEA